MFGVRELVFDWPVDLGVACGAGALVAAGMPVGAGGGMGTPPAAGPPEVLMATETASACICGRD